MKSKIEETLVGIGFCGLMFAVGINLSNKAFRSAFPVMILSLVVISLIMWAITNLVIHKEKEIDFECTLCIPIDEVDKLLKERKSKALANFPKGKEHMSTAKIVKGVFK